MAFTLKHYNYSDFFSENFELLRFNLVWISLNSRYGNWCRMHVILNDEQFEEVDRFKYTL